MIQIKINNNATDYTGKATFLLTNGLGALVTRLVTIQAITIGNYAQFRNVPTIQYIHKGKRKAVRTAFPDTELLVVRDWVDLSSSISTDTWTCFDSQRFQDNASLFLPENIILKCEWFIPPFSPRSLLAGGVF